jgi:hypothetical protein
MVAMRDSAQVVPALPPDYFSAGSVTVRYRARRGREKEAFESGPSDENYCAETGPAPHNPKFFIVKTSLRPCRKRPARILRKSGLHRMPNSRSGV